MLARHFALLSALLLASYLQATLSAPTGDEESSKHDQHRHEHGASGQLVECTMDNHQANHKEPAIGRAKRQVVQPMGPSVGQQQQPNLLGMLSELGPMVERAQSTMRLFSSSSSNGNGNAGGLSSFPGFSGLSAALPAGLTNPFQQASQEQQLKQQLERSLNSVGAAPATPSSNPLAQLETFMGPLTAMVRSTQDNTAKVAAGAQQNVQQAGQQTMAAAQGAQTGVLAALSDLGQGLKRIASNNPALGQDVKHLYASVSSKLVPSASGVPGAAAAPVPSTNNIHAPASVASNQPQAPPLD